MTPEEIVHQKEVEYYASSVNAWFNTSLEHDKSVLTLAAGGIGLLLTLLTTVGLSSAESLILYIAAITSFLVALIAVLVVFRHNRTYIEQILTGKTTGNDPVLSKADTVALWAFGLGVVFTAIIGIAAAVHSFTSKDKAMANESSKSNQSVPLRESFNGATNLQPATDFTKSFNGAGNLAPQAPMSPITSPTTTSPSSSGTSNSTQNQSSPSGK